MNAEEKNSLHALCIDDNCSIPIFTYLHDLEQFKLYSNIEIKSKCLTYVIRHQHKLPIIQYLIQCGADITYNDYEPLTLCFQVIKLDHELCHELIKHYDEIPAPIISQSVIHPNITLDIVQKLCAKCPNYDIYHLLPQLTINYIADIVRYFIEQSELDLEVLDILCKNAIQHNDLDTVKYAISYGAKIPKLDTDIFLMCQSDSIIRYLIAHNPSGTINTLCLNAFVNNNLYMLKLTVKYGANIKSLNLKIPQPNSTNIELIQYLIQCEVGDLDDLRQLSDYAISTDNKYMLQCIINYRNFRLTKEDFIKCKNPSIFLGLNAFDQTGIDYLNTLCRTALETNNYKMIVLTLCCNITDPNLVRQAYEYAIYTDNKYILSCVIRCGYRVTVEDINTCPTVSIFLGLWSAFDIINTLDKLCIKALEFNNYKIMKGAIRRGVRDPNILRAVCNWALIHNNKILLIQVIKQGICLTLDDIDNCQHIKIFRDICKYHYIHVSKDCLFRIYFKAVKHNDHKTAYCAGFRICALGYDSNFRINQTSHTMLITMIQVNGIEKYDFNKLICEAVRRSNLKLLKYIITYGVKQGNNILCYINNILKLALAVNYTDVSVIQYILDQGATVNGELLTWAIQNEKYDLITLCLDNGIIPKCEDVVLAIEKQYMECIPWLLRRACDIEVFEYIIQYSHYDAFLRIVHYVHDIHYNYDASLRLAAQCGKLQMVQYLITVCDAKWYYKSNDCDNAILMAVREGHVEVVKWMICNAGGYWKFENMGYTAMRYAIDNYDTYMIQYLLSTKINFDDNLLQNIHRVLSIVRADI